MIVPTNLPRIRGNRPRKEIAALAGVNVALISQIEAGRMLPPEKHIAALERAYGCRLHEMYPSFVLAACTRELLDEDVA